MLTRIRDGVIASFVRAWLATSSGSWRRLPQPIDEPHVYAAGDRPHRILLLGNGIAMSYGVLSHQIGVGGHLARQLAERTKRGSDVELVVGAELDPAAALSVIAEIRPARFDAIVLTLGGAEAIRLAPAVEWRRGLDALLGLIINETTTATEIILMGVPPLDQVVRIPRFARRFILRRADEIAEHARAASASHERTSYLPFSPRMTDLVLTRDRTTYEEWGALVAEGVAHKLGANEDQARALEKRERA